MQYQFDEFSLDTERLELFKSGKPLHCEPQVIQLLVLLVNNHDHTVSKEEINQVIWHGRIVSEAALSSRIKMLRQLLGDDGHTQRFIRTVHKRGFRFVAALAPDVNTEPKTPLTTSPALPGTKPSLANKPAVMVLPFSNLSGRGVRRDRPE